LYSFKTINSGDVRLYAVKLKLRLRIDSVSNYFYYANRPQTTGVKLKLLRGRNEVLQKIRAALWRWRNEVETASHLFFRRMVLWV